MTCLCLRWRSLGEGNIVSSVSENFKLGCLLTNGVGKNMVGHSGVEVGARETNLGVRSLQRVFQALGLSEITQGMSVNGEDHGEL